MDWLTFIASIAKAFAWPSVIIVLLLLLREHLGGLASRLSEVSFPGGGKAKFSAQLDEARRRSEPIVAKGKKQKRVGADTTRANDAYLTLAKMFPEAAVMEAFKELDGVIMEYWDRVPGEKKIWMDALRPLLNEKLVSQEDINLFHRLRLMRNTAVHASPQQRVTPAEAIEYRDLTIALVGRFRDAFEAYVEKHKAH